MSRRRKIIKKLDKLSLDKSSTNNVNKQFIYVNRFMTDKYYILNILKLIYKLTYVLIYDKISILIKMTINKDYFRFIFNILRSLNK